MKNSLKVISHNKRRFQKKLTAVKDRGKCLHVQELKDPAEEAEYVADQIEQYIDAGNAAEEDCCPVPDPYRCPPSCGGTYQNGISRSRSKSIFPNLYDHFIAKDIQAYLRLAIGGRERRDFLQVMNRPETLYRA